MTWPELVFDGANWLWWLIGSVSAVAAAVILLKNPLPLPSKIRALSPKAEFRWAVAIWGAALPVWIVLLKMAQYRNFQLTSDSAHVVHYSWNAIHGHGYYSSMYGMPTLAGHFSLLSAILSPFLLLWNDLDVYVILHGLALGSTIFGVYLLAKRRTTSRLLPWLLALMAVAHPRFHDLMGTILEDSVFATPLFVWAAYFLESGHPVLAVGSFALMLTAKEEGVAVLFGVGLYYIFRKERRPALGAGLVAGSLLLALFEFSLIRWIRSGLPAARIKMGTGYFFPALGGSSEEALWNLVHKPWVYPAALVFPLEKLWPALQNLLFSGLFPLLSGAALLPIYCTWLPHQLGNHFNYHRLLGYYSGFILGPIFVATVVGATAAWTRVGPKKTRLLAAYILFVVSFGLFSIGAYNTKLMPSVWKTIVPKLIPLIPPESKLWCEGYLTPHFALRRYIKYLPNSFPNQLFEDDLYMPDQVLLSEYWMRISEPAAVARVMGFLRREKFEIVFQEKDLILFQRPGVAPLKGSLRPAAALAVGVDF